MKKWLYIYVLLFCSFCMGCFKDESSSKILEINPIRIENINLSETFAVYMGDSLKIEPLVFCEGIPDAKMSFKWELTGKTIVPILLDSTMYLCAKIVVQPATLPYKLKFTITDETTGIARIELFDVTVLGPYGEGIIVADTKDGLTSDLSLVMSREFTSQIPESNSQVRIFRHIWSQNNGEPLDGMVLDCITNSYGSNRSMTILTTEHILRADYYDYFNIEEEMDEGMFIVAPPHIGHQYTHGSFAMYSSRSDEIMNANGKITIRSQQQGVRKYNYTLYPSGVLDYDVTLMYAPEWCPAYCYDAKGKRMLFCDGGFWQAQPQTGVEKFDVRDLSDYEPFFLDEISQGVVLLAKQRSTGLYKGLVMNVLRKNASNFAKTVFDFSSATEIQNAKFFDVNQLEDVIYYATETKLYATSTVNMNAQVQCEIPVGSGDKITGIKVYDFGSGRRMHQEIDSKGQSVEVFNPSSKRMIMIYTYNEANQEGKIVCVPIKTLGRGGLEQNRAFHVTLSGFNKIIGVYKQNK